MATLRGTNLHFYDAYTDSLLDTLAKGRTVARIAVSPQGRPTGCHIASSAGFYEMDRAVCTIFIRRARLTAAMDAGGNPVDGQYAAKVTWTSP